LADRVSMTSIWDEVLAHSDLDKKSREKHCEIAAGRICPTCGKADLKYNGVLSLVCPQCGQEFSGSFT
jgi:ribosomal protein L37AE/L43A